MLHLGLDLCRQRLDVCALDERGERVAVTTAPPDAEGLRDLVRSLAPPMAFPSMRSSSR
jgi:hypothetical protein